jgi:hypothetical protein
MAFAILFVVLAAGIYLQKFSWSQAAMWLTVAATILYVFYAFGWNMVGGISLVAILSLFLLIAVFNDGIIIPWWYR